MLMVTDKDELISLLINRLSPARYGLNTKIYGELYQDAYYYVAIKALPTMGFLYHSTKPDNPVHYRDFLGLCSSHDPSFGRNICNIDEW